MMTVFFGPPECGKSEQAESYIVAKTEPKERVYVATMLVEDEAGRKRVFSHRQRRAGKSFQTIEKPREIGSVLENIQVPHEKTVLLECLSNLTANEWFLGGYAHTEEQMACAEKNILDDLQNLEAQVKELVIVTTNFARSDAYDEETNQYIGLLQKLNRSVRNRADQVIEVGT